MKRVLAIAVLMATSALAQSTTPISLATDNVRVHSNATVSSSSSTIPAVNFSGRQVDLVVNAKGTFTGSPSLIYCLQEVDPGDRTTVIGQQYCSDAITAAATKIISLPMVSSGMVKVSWTFTGTSITQVFATLRGKAVPGNLGQDSGADGSVSVQCSDANINACGASSTVSIAMAGQFSTSVTIPASSTLVTVLKPDCGFDSKDGSSTLNWKATYFDDPTLGVLTSYTTVSGTVNSLTIIGCGGASRVRVRASSSPTGSGTLTLKGTFITDPTVLLSGPADSTTQPPRVAQMGGWDGSALRALGTDNTFKAFHVSQRPPEVLGCWSLGGSQAYTATTAAGIIFSFRWGDATRIALVLKVQVMVIATAFGGTAGLVERQLVVVRPFTASDTGGTSVLPAANKNELRTSFPTTLLTDARFGGFLTAGTGTPDAQPLATVANWMSAVGNVIGNGQPVTLFDATGGFQYPLTLVQNEGFRIQLNATEAASTRQTFVNVVYCEANAF